METKKQIGFWPVLFAITGNSLVAAMKFIAYLFSGSSVMFSEAIHSFADTMNQVLLMVGIKRSVKQPNEDYVYGFGRERFFWSLISACGIFFLGAGVTISHGLDSLFHPEDISINIVIVIILLASFVIELGTFMVALRELLSHNKNGVADALKNGDPSTLAVLYEDGVAVIGVIIALVCLAMANYTGKGYWDGIGSIVIGLLLVVVALMLIIKNREYLLGKSIPDDLKKKVIKILEDDPTIDRVIDFKSSTLAPGIYRIKCEVEFNATMLLNKIFNEKSFSISEEYERVRDDYEEFKKFCLAYADRVPRLVGKKIDELEGMINKEIPGAKHIDIEIN
jgi:zinc transporter 9